MVCKDGCDVDKSDVFVDLDLDLPGGRRVESSKTRTHVMYEAVRTKVSLGHNDRRRIFIFVVEKSYR